MGRSSYQIHKPLGVIGIISPWNFPWATPLDEVVMALMAGDSVVLKPSELTPEMFRDWGDDVDYTRELGRGECAA